MRSIRALLRETRTLGPDDSVRDAERALAGARVTALPVVDEGNRLLGTVSQTELDKARSQPMSVEQSGELVTDVAEYADLEQAPSSARGTCVADVMNTEPVTGELDMPLDQLAAQMSDAGVHEIPIVDNGSLAGVVSALEVMELVADELARKPR